MARDSARREPMRSRAGSGPKPMGVRRYGVIEFELDAEVLGNTIFGVSPLAEVASSLRVLGAQAPDPVYRPWLAETRGPLRRLPAGDVDVLMQVAPASKWAPDFLFPPVVAPKTTFAEQLHVVSGLAIEVLVDDLTTVWPGASWPPQLRGLLDRGADAPEALARLLASYWSVGIAPYWDRILAVLEEDVSFRASRSLRGGLFDLLADLHPRVTLSGSRLLIAMSAHADASYGQAKLSLVPSVFVWPGMVLTHGSPGKFEVTYSARGAGRVWEGKTHARTEGDALAALLGRSRAAILDFLSVPVSTTQIAHYMRQSPALVSQHLAVLRDCGLATSRRNGRSVLYQQTPLATSLMTFNQARNAENQRTR